MNPTEAAHELRKIVLECEAGFLAIPDEAASQPPASGKWSRKQILGHLIDSAANNHQRFIRMQLAPELHFPGYQQNEWVDRNGYASRPWNELVELWAAYNRHLAHVMERLDPAALKNIWDSGSFRYDLAFVAVDYVDHLRHHVEQIAQAA